MTTKDVFIVLSSRSHYRRIRAATHRHYASLCTPNDTKLRTHLKYVRKWANLTTAIVNKESYWCAAFRPPFFHSLTRSRLLSSYLSFCKWINCAHSTSSRRDITHIKTLYYYRYISWKCVSFYRKLFSHSSCVLNVHHYGHCCWVKANEIQGDSSFSYIWNI